MLSGLEILFQVVAETLRWCRLTLRSSRSIKAENLFLRRQLAPYVERGVKPQRIDPLTRIALTLLSRLFSWQDALVVPGVGREATCAGRAFCACTLRESLPV